MKSTFWPIFSCSKGHFLNMSPKNWEKSPIIRRNAEIGAFFAMVHVWGLSLGAFFWAFISEKYGILFENRKMVPFPGPKAPEKAPFCDFFGRNLPSAHLASPRAIIGVVALKIRSKFQKVKTPL